MATTRFTGEAWQRYASTHNGRIDHIEDGLEEAHTLSRVSFVANDRGYITESVPFQYCNANTVVSTAGRMEFVKIRVPFATSVTSIIMQLVTNGSTLTAGQCFAALYSPTRALVGQTADQAANWVAGANKLVMALTGGPFAVSAGDHFVGFWFNGTTGPAFMRSCNFTSGGVNGALASPNLLVGSADTGLTTTAPGTMGAQTANAPFWYVALS